MLFFEKHYRIIQQNKIISTPEVKTEKQKQLFRCMKVCMQMHISLFVQTKEKTKPEVCIPICYNKIYKYQTINAVTAKQKRRKL